MATSYYERANKKAGKILKPDYWIEYTVDDILSGRDPFFDKALELIEGGG